jgi:hypothetical protein
LSNLESSPPNKAYRYKVKQTIHGAPVKIKGNPIDEVVADYSGVRVKPESKGFEVATEQ